MSTAVLIPFRAGCVHRNRALMYVISRHAENGWPVILGQHTDGPWCKALAVQDALEQTAADVLVIADADVWIDRLPAAVAHVERVGGWAMPHRSVARLTEASTEAYMRRGMLDGLPLEERAYGGTEGGGIIVIAREAYEAVPLDPRFLGWGSEDEAHGIALRTLYGPPDRPTVYAPLVHLWHPAQKRASRAFGSLAGRDLRKRYVRASGNRWQMTELIEEAACRLQRC